MEKTTDTDVTEPRGFAKWLGRIVALVLMLLALAIGFAMLSEGTSSGNSAPSQGEPGLKLTN